MGGGLWILGGLDLGRGFWAVEEVEAGEAVLVLGVVGADGCFGFLGAMLRS